MTSNMFSRLMPSSRHRSFYDELRTQNGNLHLEDRAGLLDEENLNHDFQDYDLDQAERLGVEDSRASLGGRTRPDEEGVRRVPARGARRSAWQIHEEDQDNDVPASLLVERHDDVVPTTRPKQTTADRHRPAVPGPSAGRKRAQWEVAQTQQKLHDDRRIPALPPAGPGTFVAAQMPKDAKTMAGWRWANVSNLDIFIKDVYDYYQGCGIWCILLERAIHLVTVVFVAVFLTFLTQCIDYSRIKGSTIMSQILVEQCTRKMSGLWNLGLWSFTFYLIWKSIQNLLDMRRLFIIRDFYSELLGIPEHDMQTVTWQDVVARIMALRDQNTKTATSLTPEQRRFLGSQSKERLDASDIANRLMRRENYLIALFNKDILDLTIPLPFLQNRQLLSRTLEWTLGFSILDFVFDDQGQVNQQFLRSDRRGELSAKLRRRFVFAGTMMIVLSPFLAGYLVIVYFLTYYNEYQRNPSAIGSRTYTPLAEWKFREFNELPHLFRKRLNMSHPFATHYIDQFPKVKTEMVARAVAFVAGSLATVLAIVSLIDSESFLSFEITSDRTVLFYIGILGSIWAFAHGSMTEENAVFDPEYALRSVVEYTHYQPDHWHDRLHSFEVKREFSELYKIKLLIFLEEIFSILTTPFVLFVSLPKSSDQIIDFFREFTIHVDGLGYVCSFAEFDFKKGLAGGRKPEGGAVDVRDDYYSTKYNKAEMSIYGFMGNYGNYALNAKTGVQGHLPPAMRHQFHPPPAWPGMGSPTLAADLQTSRMGRSERARSRAPAITPRFGPALPQPSPMASILLDPHHQPANTGVGRSRQQRGAYHGDSNIIEESPEDDTQESDVAKNREDEPYQGGGGSAGDALDESTWQTSPTHLSRQNSATEGREGPDAGVVHMIYQFNQAQLNRRPGGGVR